MPLYVRIKKNFGSFSLDAEFEARNGVTGLLGASGCGKSMTLKCVAGVVRPDEGKIISDGRTLFDSSRGINLPPQRRGVGLLFQNYALFPNMTVEGNITSVLRAGGKGRGGSYASLIKKFRLSGLENHYPDNLSGGQRQRAALARIMASGPGIIMLDEPLSALDSYLRWQLEGELARILEEFGGVALYVSHNRDEVFRLCRDVCVMNSGRTEPLRTARELFDSPDTLASCLLSGCKNYSRAERIGERRVRALDWNAELDCERPVGGDVEYIGVRAHFVRIGGRGNVLSCVVERITRDVFHTIVNLRPVGALTDLDFSLVRMEIPDDPAASLRVGNAVSVSIMPEDVMLLKR